MKKIWVCNGGGCVGSWLHCGYHLTSAIVAPALLSLPFAMAMLGWVGGVMCLSLGGLVTFYSYNLLSLVLEHHAQLGKRQLRFRDMAHDILGTVFLFASSLSLVFGTPRSTWQAVTSDFGTWPSYDILEQVQQTAGFLLYFIWTSSGPRPTKLNKTTKLQKHINPSTHWHI